MAKKQKQKQASLKHIRLAAEYKQEERKGLIKLLLAVLGGVVMWALFSFTPLNDHSWLGSMLIFIIVLIVVFLIGEVGVKFSRSMTEYNKIKNEYGVTDEMVKDYMSKNK
ncbi:MAG: hypothetical protein Q4D06_02110 [Coriobacteriia bacterium]|nr:hypothetical protein [Coriobacteriia bacterium]